MHKLTHVSHLLYWPEKKKLAIFTALTDKGGGRERERERGRERDLIGHSRLEGSVLIWSTFLKFLASFFKQKLQHELQDNLQTSSGICLSKDNL